MIKNKTKSFEKHTISVQPGSIVLKNQAGSVVRTLPLTQLRRWAAKAGTLTLDLGDYEDDYMVMQTTSSSEISEAIAGQIDLIISARKDSAATSADETLLPMYSHSAVPFSQLVSVASYAPTPTPMPAPPMTTPTIAPITTSKPITPMVTTTSTTTAPTVILPASSRSQETPLVAPVWGISSSDRPRTSLKDLKNFLHKSSKKAEEDSKQSDKDSDKAKNGRQAAEARAQLEKEAEELERKKMEVQRKKEGMKAKVVTEAKARQREEMKARVEAEAMHRQREEMQAKAEMEAIRQAKARAEAEAEAKYRQREEMKPKSEERETASARAEAQLQQRMEEEMRAKAEAAAAAVASKRGHLDEEKKSLMDGEARLRRTEAEVDKRKELRESRLSSTRGQIEHTKSEKPATGTEGLSLIDAYSELIDKFCSQAQPLRESQWRTMTLSSLTCVLPLNCHHSNRLPSNGHARLDLNLELDAYMPADQPSVRSLRMKIMLSNSVWKALLGSNEAENGELELSPDIATEVAGKSPLPNLHRALAMAQETDQVGQQTLSTLMDQREKLLKSNARTSSLLDLSSNLLGLSAPVPVPTDGVATTPALPRRIPVPSPAPTNAPIPMAPILSSSSLVVGPGSTSTSLFGTLAAPQFSMANASPPAQAIQGQIPQLQSQARPSLPIQPKLASPVTGSVDTTTSPVPAVWPIYALIFSP